jgi:hypothetical protein
MPASEANKGKEAEREVARALRRRGWRAITSRDARGGAQGGADLISDFPLVIEVKNRKALDLAGWWAQAKDQAGDDLPAVIHKRRGKSRAEDWWVLMDLATLLDLVGPPEGLKGADLDRIDEILNAQRDIDED